MIEFESIVDAQVRAMLEGIRQDLEARHAQMLAEAKKQARVLLSSARRQARARVSQAVAEERDQRDHSLQRASASLASRIRRKQQALDKSQLALGHERLREALIERWADPKARADWAATLMLEAQSLLSNSTWEIEYPAGMDTGEAARLLKPSRSGATVELAPAADIEAGFRLHHADAQLDMSVAGLLAQVDEMAGELLAEIHRQQEELGAQS
jgi:vacuolar-type H+-ATPase subunit E/Vma4